MENLQIKFIILVKQGEKCVCGRTSGQDLLDGGRPSGGVGGGASVGTAGTHRLGQSV